MDALPALTATGLGKRYRELVVLDQCDLQIARGEVVAIRGRSGTGKSTLLHCLGLLDRPDVGSISIGETVVDELSQKQRSQVRARQLGFVFQGFQLLPEFSLIENIVMAARCAGRPLSEARQRAEILIDALGMSGRENSDVQVLSGGERQRVAIARALLNTPALILADEPTGNLDPTTAAEVVTLLADAARADGCGVVLVTHDPAIADLADRRLELGQGRLQQVDSLSR